MFYVARLDLNFTLRIGKSGSGGCNPHLSIPFTKPYGALSQGEIVSMGKDDPPHEVVPPTEVDECRNMGTSKGVKNEELTQAQGFGGAHSPSRGRDTRVANNTTLESRTTGIGTKETPRGSGRNSLE